MRYAIDTDQIKFAQLEHLLQTTNPKYHRNLFSSMVDETCRQETHFRY